MSAEDKKNVIEQPVKWANRRPLYDERDQEIEARANSKALGFGAGCLELFTVLCAVKGESAWRGGLALLLLGLSASMLYRSSAYEEKPYLWGGLLLGALGATLLAWFTFGS